MISNTDETFALAQPDRRSQQRGVVDVERRLLPDVVREQLFECWTEEEQRHGVATFAYHDHARTWWRGRVARVEKQRFLDGCQIVEPISATLLALQLFHQIHGLGFSRVHSVSSRSTCSRL